LYKKHGLVCIAVKSMWTVNRENTVDVTCCNLYRGQAPVCIAMIKMREKLYMLKKTNLAYEQSLQEGRPLVCIAMNEKNVLWRAQ